MLSPSLFSALSGAGRLDALKPWFLSSASGFRVHPPGSALHAQRILAFSPALFWFLHAQENGGRIMGRTVGAGHPIGPRRRALGHRIRQRRRTECRPSSGGTSSYSPACKRTEKTRDKCPNPVCACKHDPIPISISVTDDTRYGYMDPRRPMRSVILISI